MAHLDYSLCITPPNAMPPKSFRNLMVRISHDTQEIKQECSRLIGDALLF